MSDFNKTATPLLSRAVDYPEDSYHIDPTDGPISSTANTKWGVANGTSHFEVTEVKSQLDSGQYSISYDGDRFFFDTNKINIDDLLHLPSESNDRAINNIRQFWNCEDKFKKHGFVWKRGILLWGPPGVGKTCITQQIAAEVISQGGIIIRSDVPSYTRAGLKAVRRVEPTRRIVVLLEDIDAQISSHGDHDLLAMLDGEDQINNVLYVATTNYPQNLDDRFINRPSRFDEIIKVTVPTKEARAKYLISKVERFDESSMELNEWVERTDRFSIAHLKELIISVDCFDNSLDVAIKKLESMVNMTTTQYSDSDSDFKGFSN